MKDPKLQFGVFFVMPIVAVHSKELGGFPRDTSNRRLECVISNKGTRWKHSEWR